MAHLISVLSTVTFLRLHLSWIYLDTCMAILGESKSGCCCGWACVRKSAGSEDGARWKLAVLIMSVPESQSWSQPCILWNSNNVHKARGCAATGWSMQHAHIAPYSTLPHVSIPQLVLHWAERSYLSGSATLLNIPLYYTEGHLYCSFCPFMRHCTKQLNWCCDQASREPSM